MSTPPPPPPISTVGWNPMVGKNIILHLAMKPLHINSIYNSPSDVEKPKSSLNLKMALRRSNVFDLPKFRLRGRLQRRSAKISNFQTTPLPLSGCVRISKTTPPPRTSASGFFNFYTFLNFLNLYFCSLKQS